MRPLRLLCDFSNGYSTMTWQIPVSFEEFQEGSKQDPTIVQALSLYDGLV